MSTMNLLETAYNLAIAADVATDKAVHEEIAKIVKAHAKIGLAAAWIPVPGADLAVMIANTWTMYVRINKALKLPFSEHVIKSLASGIATNLLSNLPILGVSSILKAIPGVGTITGGVIMSAAIYSTLIAAGIVYMKALTFMLKNKSEMTEVNLKAAVDTLTKSKSELKNIFNQAEGEYKSAKASGELNNKES